MKRFVAVLALAGVVAGCSLFPAPATPTPAPASSVTCRDIAATQANPTLMANVNAEIAKDPHSAFSVLWADVAASCPGGVPVSSVSPAWFQNVVSMLQALLPTVLPILIGVL
jgi:hypothetical protein